MLKRAITGAVFITVLIGSALSGATVFTIFFSAVGVWCLYEFFGMVRQQQDVLPVTGVGIFSAILLGFLLGLHHLEALPLRYTAIIIPCISLIFIVPLYRGNAKPFHDISYTLTGLLYTAFPFFCFVALGFIRGSYHAHIPLGFLFMLWSNDTGAYLVGRSIGRTKLFERISPNKTWEGFLGGLAFAIGVAALLSQFYPVLPLWQWMIMGLIIGSFGTLGDLVESMLKRTLGVKDSGNILPGHGGLLDRFDGLLIAAPLVWIFLLLV
ncbi:phosphatidate cytidylyltransferase [Sphingobacterium sp. lm-10]|uniref:phosphatidate cytidylyltransferase n=1 Tax=Sphingobacterium sp. lm-10 TaxID=2944904 RepID=UPI00202216EC|nr:phosphatidate cytidylyltransferase [Sphingobacterium sp. lm-10]MCL7988588.1 phosphatidate cytidylyltransferase [Sphingobacterium sp. lm-10]